MLSFRNKCPRTLFFIMNFRMISTLILQKFLKFVSHADYQHFISKVLKLFDIFTFSISDRNYRSEKRPSRWKNEIYKTVAPDRSKKQRYEMIDRKR